MLFLLRKNYLDALNVVLKSAPLNTKNLEVKVSVDQSTVIIIIILMLLIKDNSFNLVVQVLRSFSNVNDIDNAVKSLDVDSLDILMKYIYKGFENEAKYSNVFLNWHEKVKIKNDY